MLKKIFVFILMTINYDIILEYLFNNSDNFYNKQNIIQYSNKFKYFNNIFTLSYYRYGIFNTYNNLDISLWSSLLFCLEPSYISKNIDEVIEIIGQFKNNIINDFDKSLVNLDKSLYDVVNNNLNDELLLEVIVNHLKINVLIFDFENGDIYACYYKNYFNPWRPTVYLAKCKNKWEPIISNKNKYFNINNDIDKILSNKILLEDINYFNTFKDFTINDNFNSIIDLEELIQKLDTNIIKSKVDYINNIETNKKEDLFVSHNSLIKNITKNKLNKMKKNDILNLINELNLEININKPVKNDLILFLSEKLNLK
jgi:hypothetical protein